MKRFIITKDPKSSTSEAIRTLRTNLEFSFVDGLKKTVMITSSVPHEGKSFITANLACAFGMTNKKTLIIDCDLRRGTQHKYFGIVNEVGLSDLLMDNLRSYKKYINTTGVDNVHLLSSGTQSSNPSELLGSEKMKNLINKIKENYDLIILDCPPVNAVADALVISNIADEALIVAVDKKTPIDLLLTTKKALENTGIKIVGIVLNKIDKQNKKYYKKYYGKYYY